MNNSGSVSVGHGPGTRGNEGTAQDRGTPVPASNLTEIDATQEGGAERRDQRAGAAPHQASGKADSQGSGAQAATK